MRDRVSLADRVVYALALIRQMDADISSGDDHRFAVWKLKNAAEAAIASGCQMAIELNDAAEAVKRSAKPAAAFAGPPEFPPNEPAEGA